MVERAKRSEVGPRSDAKSIDHASTLTRSLYALVARRGAVPAYPRPPPAPGIASRCSFPSTPHSVSKTTTTSIPNITFQSPSQIIQPRHQGFRHLPSAELLTPLLKTFVSCFLVKMVIKRKRSESELSSFSSAFSSPTRPDPQSLDTLTVGQINWGTLSSRSSTPTHLPSRTMKRFRDNRPSETEVHREFDLSIFRYYGVGY